MNTPRGFVAGKSAPELVDELQMLWTDLPERKRIELGCRWVDHALRTVLPEAFERGRHDHIASFLRTLPRITNISDLKFVQAQLSAVRAPLEDVNINLVTALLNTEMTIGELAQRFDLYQCCFQLVMTSRLVYGNNRLVEMMRMDLLAAGGTILA